MNSRTSASLAPATSTAQFRAWQQRELPPVERLSGGVWSIPVPVPIATLGYVLVYALELSPGVALVDAGWPDDTGWSALTAGLATAGHTPSDVRAILVTHAHRDHFGLAERVRAESGAWVGLHPEDARLLADRSRPAGAATAATPEWLIECGVPADVVPDMLRFVHPARAGAPMAPPDRLVADGERVRLGSRELVAVWTPGHSPGHLCFVDPESRRLFSGDHVLPRISPHVSTTSTAVDSLGTFLASQAKVLSEQVDEALPAHEYRFTGLADRVRQIREHHRERLGEIGRILGEDPGLTTWQIAERLSWSRDWAQMTPADRRSAVAETLAHVVLLAQHGYVAERTSAPARWALTVRWACFSMD